MRGGGAGLLSESLPIGPGDFGGLGEREDLAGRLLYWIEPALTVPGDRGASTGGCVYPRMGRRCSSWPLPSRYWQGNPCEADL